MRACPHQARRPDPSQRISRGTAIKQHRGRSLWSRCCLSCSRFCHGARFDGARFCHGVRFKARSPRLPRPQGAGGQKSVSPAPEPCSEPRSPPGPTRTSIRAGFPCARAWRARLSAGPRSFGSWMTPSPCQPRLRASAAMSGPPFPDTSPSPSSRKAMTRIGNRHLAARGNAPSEETSSGEERKSMTCLPVDRCARAIPSERPNPCPWEGQPAWR